MCGISCLCIMARSDVSFLAQETTTAIVLFAGKLHVLACLSLAWKDTVSRVKRTVIDSFLASDLDLSFVPTQRSLDNMNTRLARLGHHEQHCKITTFWFKAQLRIHWFFQERRRCVGDFAKVCWEKLPMPCAYLSVLGNDGRRIILPEGFHNKGDGIWDVISWAKKCRKYCILYSCWRPQRDTVFQTASAVATWREDVDSTPSLSKTMI